MPRVNADLHNEIQKYMETIKSHEMFSDIMTADPLEIDASAEGRECGYKDVGRIICLGLLWGYRAIGL
eukprot:4047703-Pyramimonas_sp.AAC.1